MCIPPHRQIVGEAPGAAQQVGILETANITPRVGHWPVNFGRRFVTAEDARRWTRPFAVAVKTPMQHWCLAIDRSAHAEVAQAEGDNIVRTVRLGK
jgi:hypothetical protein